MEQWNAFLRVHSTFFGVSRSLTPARSANILAKPFIAWQCVVQVSRAVATFDVALNAYAIWRRWRHNTANCEKNFCAFVLKEVRSAGYSNTDNSESTRRVRVRVICMGLKQNWVLIKDMSILHSTSTLRIDTTFVTGGRYFEYINKTIYFNPNDVYIFGNANKLWK